MSYFDRQRQMRNRMEMVLKSDSSSWDESKHPRDERGRFADSGGTIDPDKYAETGGLVPAGLRADPERNDFARYTQSLATTLERYATGDEGALDEYHASIYGAAKYGLDYANSVRDATLRLLSPKARYEVDLNSRAYLQFHREDYIERDSDVSPEAAKRYTKSRMAEITAALRAQDRAEGKHP